MKIQTYQENILALLKGNPLIASTEDDYFLKLKKSSSLRILKEIVIWWRLYQLEQYCPLTTTLLKKGGIFESTVNNFYEQYNVSSYIEELGLSFLDFLIQIQSGDFKSIAAFESAMIQTKKGNKNVFLIEWENDPQEVLAFILYHQPMEKRMEQKKFITKVAAHLPSFFETKEIL